MPENKIISKINYNGQTYDIYDETGRFAVEGHHHDLTTLDGIAIANNYNATNNPIATVSTVSAAVNSITAQSLGLSQALKFIGFATVTISDGSTTDPVISGYTTRSVGDVVISRDTQYEFVWTSAGMWEQLGPDGSFIISGGSSVEFTPTGTIANTGSVTNYTPTGTFDALSFHGGSSTVWVSGTPRGTITVTSTATDASHVGNYTPSGTISASFTTTTLTASITGTTDNFTIDAHSYKPAGSISSTSTGTKNYTPAGEITASFTTTAMTSHGEYTPKGSVTRTTDVALTTTTFNTVTSTGVLPEFSMTVTGEKLTYGWSNGQSVQVSTVTVATGITAQPTFTFSGTGGTVEVSGTTVNAITATFSGTPTRLEFSGTTTTLAHAPKAVAFEGTATYSMVKAISATFNGTLAHLMATFSGEEFNSSGSFTPTGTIDPVVFHGTGAKLIFIGDEQHIVIE